MNIGATELLILGAVLLFLGVPVLCMAMWSWARRTLRNPYEL